MNSQADHINILWQISVNNMAYYINDLLDIQHVNLLGQLPNSLIHHYVNLFVLLSLEFSFGDPTEESGIKLTVVILELIQCHMHKVVNFIIISLIQDWQCMGSDKTLRRRTEFSKSYMSQNSFIICYL